MDLVLAGDRRAASTAFCGRRGEPKFCPDLTVPAGGRAGAAAEQEPQPLDDRSGPVRATADRLKVAPSTVMMGWPAAARPSPAALDRCDRVLGRVRCRSIDVI